MALVFFLAVALLAGVGQLVDGQVLGAQNLVLPPGIKFPVVDPALRAIVAVAKLAAPKGKNSTGRGFVTLILPRQDKGNSTISVILSGSMSGVTMAHIHLSNTTLSNPIRLDVLPRLTSAKPALLNPPLSYKGNLTFSSTFGEDSIRMWGSDMDFVKFQQYLRDGMLYFNVHTTANPGGEIQGKLWCQGECMWMVCGALPGAAPGGRC